MVYGLWIGCATSLIGEVNCVPMKNQEMRGNSYCLIRVKCAPMHEVLSKLIVVSLFWIIEWKGELKLAPFAERGLSTRRSKAEPSSYHLRAPRNLCSWGCHWRVAKCVLHVEPSWIGEEAMLKSWKMSRSMLESTGLGSFTILASLKSWNVLRSMFNPTGCSWNCHDRGTDVMDWMVSMWFILSLEIRSQFKEYDYL